MNAPTLEALHGAAAVEQPLTAQRTVAAPVRAPGRPGRRHGRRHGRGSGPQARPARPLTGAPARRPAVPRPQSCSVEAPGRVVPGTGAWRLTERGIALVLVTALLIVTAALTVVGLTALRVTGDRYAGAGLTALVQS